MFLFVSRGLSTNGRCMGTGEPLRQSKRVNRGEITPTDQRQVWDRQPRQGVGRARHTEFLAAAFDFRVTSGVSPSTDRPTDRPTDRRATLRKPQKVPPPHTPRWEVTFAGLPSPKVKSRTPQGHRPTALGRQPSAHIKRAHHNRWLFTSCLPLATDTHHHNS